MTPRIILAAVLLLASLGGAAATPSRIIILRHGEKADPWKLCQVGQQRANALAADYLGRNAKQSLFDGEEQPAAFVAVTLHTLELAAPAAASWNLPVLLYSAVPEVGGKVTINKELNRRTQQAAQDVMANPAFAGKTVVMVWEHKHIANAKLAAANKQAVTLRELLKLDTLRDVPDTWPSENYDYFWVIDYAPGSDVPTKFAMVKQQFAAPYDKLPDNDWNKPTSLKPASGCELRH